MLPVPGSHTRSTHDPANVPANISTLPVCIITMLTATIPMSNGAPHCPTTAGLDVLLTVTMTAADVVRLPAASRATAVTLCAPSPTLVVFHVREYGEVVSSAPRSTPSTRSCTAATPTSSDALAVIVVVPNTVA